MLLFNLPATWQSRSSHSSRRLNQMWAPNSPLGAKYSIGATAENALFLDPASRNSLTNRANSIPSLPGQVGWVSVNGTQMVPEVIWSHTMKDFTGDNQNLGPNVYKIIFSNFRKLVFHLQYFSKKLHFQDYWLAIMQN